MQPWTCTRCLVPCGSEEIKCPACQELRPGYSPSDAEESSPDKPSIQFGAAPAAKAAELSSNGTPAFGPAFGAIPLPSHDPFGSSSNVSLPAATASPANVTQPPVVPPFPRAASPQQHPVFGSQQMARPEFGAHTPAKAGFSVQFGSQLSSSVDEEAAPDMKAGALNVEPVEKENHSQSVHSDSNKASSGKVDAGRFTFGTSQLAHDFSTTPPSRPAPPSPLRASGQPSPGRFLDALATTPVGTSGPDSPLLRDYDPNQARPYPKRDPSRRGILYNWGSGECDQLAVRQEILEDGMCLKPQIIRRVNQPIAKAVVCGAMHNACIVDHGHAIWTWGCNDEKALGRPVRLETKRKNADGEVYEIKIDGPLIDPCWSTVHPPPDSNYYLCKAPGPVWGLPEKVEIVKATAGDSHTAIITATGDCWVWGTYRDGTGPLGFPDFSKERGAYVRHQIVPVKIPGLMGSCIRLISGENHTVVMTYCARDRKYRVYAWGANPYGQLGGTPTDHENPREYLWPRELKLNEMQFMMADTNGTLSPHPKSDAIRRSGSVGDIYGGRATLFMQISYDGASGVFGMGRNACGELGAGCEITCVSSPVALKTPPGYVWKDIKGGDWFTMGYTHDGAVFTWGHCEYVGQGSEVALSKQNVLVPKKLPGLRQMVAEISASDKAAYIVTYSGEVFVWGENQSGQLGLGRQDEQPVARPTHVPLSFFSNQPVLSVAAGSQHGVAMVQADEAQLERGTKRRREADDEPAEDMEAIKRRRAEGEQHILKPDTSTDLPGPVKASVPRTAPNQNSTIELPLVAPSEVSPSKKEEGYISDDDESESVAVPEEESAALQQSLQEDVSMAGARIGIDPSAAEEDDEDDNEEEDDDENEDGNSVVVEDEAEAPSQARNAAAPETASSGPEEDEEGDADDEVDAEDAEKGSDKAVEPSDGGSQSTPEEEEEEVVTTSKRGVASAPKPKAKAKAKARPKRATVKPAAQEAPKTETGRSSRKRLPTISATPADGELSDISQPADAGAPKRSRVASSAVKKEERGVKRQASASPEREVSAASKKARTVKSVKKGPASQETTPIPLPPDGETTTKSTRGKNASKATGGDTTTAAAGRKVSKEESKASTSTKKATAAEKAASAAPEKRTLRRGKAPDEPAPPQEEAEEPEAQPTKRARGRAGTRTQSQEAEAEPASKVAPKKAAAKPKSKAKATKAPVKQAEETDDEVEVQPGRKATAAGGKAAASKASKSQPVASGSKSAASRKTVKTQPDEEAAEPAAAAPATKKSGAKAKAKEAAAAAPKRATRSQATKETEVEPRKTTRAKK